MTFRALLVSKDNEATATLSSILSGYGVDVACCGYPEGMCRLTEEKFDSVIVDFDDPHSAGLLLQNVDQVSQGSRAVTVALLSDKTKVRNVFGAGANFILYKPITPEQAEASLRAATALMKRERRRSFRVPVQVPVQLRVQNGSEMEGILLDLSETGMDVLAAQALCPAAVLSARFTLPDGKTEIDIRGEAAWANPNGQTGVQFIDLSDSVRTILKEWVTANAQELPPQEPEAVSQCKLTDLSLGGCYVETESPFPESSGITLCLRAENMEVQTDGTVRVMHPGFGMGIEFLSRNGDDRARVETFIDVLTSRPGTQPELLIMPRALSAGEGANNAPGASSQGDEDALLNLLHQGASLSQDDFLQQLRQQRSSPAVAAN